MKTHTQYRISTTRFPLRLRFIVAASILALVAGCGSPVTDVTLRNVAGATEKPGEAPVAQVSTAVPADKTSVNAAPTATTWVLRNVVFGPDTPTAQSSAKPATAAPTSASSGASTAAPTVASTVASTVAPTTTLAATQASAPTTAPATAPATAAANAGGASASGGQGDPQHGKQIFTGSGTCFTCHDTAQGIQIVGPSLKGVATRAETRKPGMSAIDYLHESIVKPNAFVVQGFVAGVMPQNFAQQLSAKDIDDVVAYLLTLK